MNERLYNTKIVTTDNRVEIYKMNNYVIKEGHQSSNENGRSGKKEIDKETKESNKERSRKTTLTNARNNIIRLIKSNPDMQTFITLTFKKELDFKESKKYLNTMFKKLNRQYENLKYLWVLEYGDKNGRLHYHILCNISIYIKLNSSKEKKSAEHKKLENEFSEKFWQYGFVDIRSLNQENNTNIALYVSCYITKSMENRNLEGYRIYGYSSKTLKKPVTTKIYTKDSIEDIIKNFDDYYIRFSNSYHIGYKTYKGDYYGNVTYLDLYKNKNEGC